MLAGLQRHDHEGPGVLPLPRVAFRERQADRFRPHRTYRPGPLGPIPPAYPTPTGECCPALAANRFYLSMDAYPHAWGRHAWLIRCYIP